MASKLKWCYNKKIISITKPNIDISEDYLNSAEETLKVLKLIYNKSLLWASTMKYYFEYFVFCALLLRLGIKSESHECTLNLIYFLTEIGFLEKKYYFLLKEDKHLRIENQYYLKNIKVNFDFDFLLSFFLEFKQKILFLSDEEQNDIRNKLLLFLK